MIEIALEKKIEFFFFYFEIRLQLQRLLAYCGGGLYIVTKIIQC